MYFRFLPQNLLKGVSFMEDDAGWHGKYPSEEEYEKAMSELI